MKNSRGVTLIELMTVVAIVGIFGAIGGLTIVKALPGYQLRKAASAMVADFRKARSMAIKLNRSVTLSFNASQGKYWLDGKKLPGSMPDTLTTYYGGGVAFGFPGRSSSDSVHFSNGGATITFDTTGLTGGVSGYVYLQNSKGKGYRIGVTNLAANIKMDQCESASVNCTVNP